MCSCSCLVVLFDVAFTFVIWLSGCCGLIVLLMCARFLDDFVFSWLFVSIVGCALGFIAGLFVLVL